MVSHTSVLTLAEFGGVSVECEIVLDSRLTTHVQYRRLNDDKLRAFVFFFQAEDGIRDAADVHEDLASPLVCARGLASSVEYCAAKCPACYAPNAGVPRCVRLR